MTIVLEWTTPGQGRRSALGTDHTVQFEMRDFCRHRALTFTPREAAELGIPVGTYNHVSDSDESWHYRYVGT